MGGPKSREETPKKGGGGATPIALPHCNNMQRRHEKCKPQTKEAKPEPAVWHSNACKRALNAHGFFWNCRWGNPAGLPAVRESYRSAYISRRRDASFKNINDFKG